MLIFLRLPATISTALISSLFFFTPAVNAKYYPGCFMVKASGQVINLNKLCQNKVQASQKATACQGPFDKDGFPLALYAELENFKKVLKKKPEEEILSDDIYAEVDKIFDQVYFPPEIQSLRRKLQLSYKQMNREKINSIDKVLNAIEDYGVTAYDLKSRPCYSQIVEALKQKSLLP